MSATKAISTIIFSIIGNLVLALVKGFVGYFGNSYALIADAIESTSDVFSSIVVLVGLRYSSLPPDENHPYGHGKAESVVTFIVVVLLIGSGVIIAIQSIEHILTPHKVPAPYTLIVLGAVILIKEFFFRFVSKSGKQTNSSSLKADAWHHRSDALTSGAAFIGISIALVMGEGYETADDWAALVATIIIFYNSYLIFRPAFGEIMDENRYDDLVETIRTIARTVPGVIATEKCRIRKSGMTYLVDLHITVSAVITVKEGHDVAHTLKKHLMKQIPEIADILIHFEPNER
ncbi:MAG: cation diffusion facilitator family transporter [Bacteroidota bacterium]|nr:cation diffusion facilitator family transporter [Bacteroidota bacterium]